MPRLTTFTRLALGLLPALVVAAPITASAAPQPYTCPNGQDQVTGVSDGGPTSTVTGDTDKISLVVANTPEQQDYKAQYQHIGNEVIDSAYVQMTNGTMQSFGPGDAIVDLPAPIERIDVCGHAVAPVTSLSLQTSAPRITAGNRPTLYGVVSVSGGGGDVAGRTVVIHGKSWGASQYSVLGSTVSGGDGAFTFPVSQLTQTAFVARVDNAASPAVLIRVHQRLTINQPLPGSDFMRGQRVTFSGTTLPARPNMAVGLATTATGRYTYVGETRTNAQGAWSITPRLATGTGTYVVYCSAQAGSLFGSKSVHLVAS